MVKGKAPHSSTQGIFITSAKPAEAYPPTLKLRRIPFSQSSPSFRTRNSAKAGKTIIIAIIALLVVMIGGWGVFTFFKSEEKKVKKQFRTLSEWVSKEPNENTITMAYKVKKIGTLFAESCRFKISVDLLSGQYTPDEISSYAARGRSQFIKLHLKFDDLKIEFPENETAKVGLTARLSGTSTTGEWVDETRELICVLKKIEKHWLFSVFEVVEVLKK